MRACARQVSRSHGDSAAQQFEEVTLSEITISEVAPHGAAWRVYASGTDVESGNGTCR